MLEDTAMRYIITDYSIYYAIWISITVVEVLGKGTSIQVLKLIGFDKK